MTDQHQEKIGRLTQPPRCQLDSESGLNTYQSIHEILKLNHSTMTIQHGNLRLGPATVSWKLGYTDKEGNIAYLTPQDMSDFIPLTNGGTWRHPDGLTVTVDYQTIDGICQGQLSFSGNDAKLHPIEEIIFPVATMPYDQNTRILLPVSQGMMLGNLPKLADTLEDKSTTLYRAFRFSAALFGTHGLYLDCRDSAYWNKQCRWHIENQQLVHESVFYLPLEQQSAFTLPYRCGIVPFEGDWYEATQLYSPWAHRQEWYLNSRTRSPKLKDISMWVWNRGHIQDVIPPVQQLAKDTNARIALDWYWWHHNPYDTDYPDYWPPREGEEAFTAALKRLNQQGIFTQIYMNGRTWDIDGQTYATQGQDGMESQRDGKPLAVAFNSYNHHRLGYICGESTAFHQKLEEQLDHVFKAGLPGIYLDMIGCTSGLNCYNPRHRHAPGGGTYALDGYRSMIRKFREDYPDRCFSTEDCSENWIDLFDSMIVLFSTASEKMGDADSTYVPAFNAIYHGTNALFGSYALPDFIPPWDELWPAQDRFPAEAEKDWNRLYPCQFQIEIARGVVWGMQPMVCNLKPQHREDPRFREVYQFILDTAQFHHDNLDILADATMAPPGNLHCKTVTVDFLVRGIFTHLEHLKTITKNNLPAILHTVWHNPAGGRTLILANYTPDEQEFSFETIHDTLPPRSYRRIDL